MAPTPERHSGPWSIILAGGEGERTRPFIERWLGRHKPKQYCTFVGTRSLFQHTVDRADGAGSPERRLAVVARWHEREVREQLAKRESGQVLKQPENRGTAAGIFLPLAHVLAKHPEATVVVYPSDHYVHPEEAFGKVVLAAVSRVETHPDKVVLLGAEPDGPETEYGWVEPGRLEAAVDGRRVRHARGFLEKPSPAEAESALAHGALWNTFVMVASGKTLWKLGQDVLPELLVPFEWLRQNVGGPEEAKVLRAIYERLPERDFCRDLLQRVPDRLSVIEMDGIVWSDWGRPERIVDTLRRIGREPAFSESDALVG